MAETPVIPGGRQQDFHPRTFGGNDSFPRTSSLSVYQGSHASGATGARAFDVQPDVMDDLADFMVDTDEEDEGVLFSSHRRRSGNLVHGRPSDKQAVEDMPEVPETPVKAV